MEYTLRRSKRARYLRIRVSPHLGVELVVPPGVSEAAARRFLSQRLDWVRRVQAGFTQPADAVLLPERILLPAPEREFRVERHGGARLLRRDDCLRLPADWDDQRAAAALRDWLQRQASDWLPDYCRGLATACGLGYRQLRVGLQSSRWGSYSARGTMSLNAKLLLMEASMLRYVVHHELTHSLHMNHSPEYWQALSRLEPDWQRLRASLRRAGPALPLWARLVQPRGRRGRL